MLIHIDPRTRELSEIRSLSESGVASAPTPTQPAFKTAVRRAVDSLIGHPQFRGDSAAVNAGNLADRLTAKAQQVALEPLPDLNAPLVFPPYTDIPRGAAFFTVATGAHVGEAGVWQRGGSLPRVSMVYNEARYPIHTLVSSWDKSFLDDLQAEMSELNTDADKIRACSRAVQEKANDLFWYGSNDLGTYGFLNFPGTLSFHPAINFNSAAAPADVLATLNEAVTQIDTGSKGTLAPNAMVMSRRLHRYLSTTLMGAAAPNKSILAMFMEQNPKIVKIKDVWELQDAGGAAGLDYLSFYNDALDAAGLAIPMPLTALPPFAEGMNMVYPYAERIGGFRTAYAGSICHVLVDTND